MYDILVVTRQLFQYDFFIDILNICPGCTEVVEAVCLDDVALIYTQIAGLVVCVQTLMIYFSSA